MASIYISSTYRDLKEERRAARDAVVRLGHLPVAMETYTATDRRPLEQCLEDVASCHAYVGIFAWRYGFVPPGQRLSITRLEYEEAGRRGIPRLIFLLRDEALWPQNQVDRNRTKIRELREHLLAEHNLRFFRNASELAAEVSAAVAGQVGPGAPIPDLLPYLPDCKEQEEALAEALESHDRQRVSRPFVALVHGDERQCHDKFLERLQQEFLPGYFDLAADEAVTGVFLPWPRNRKNRQQIRDQLQKRFAEKALRRRTASAEKVSEALAPGPVLVHTHLLTSDWQPSGVETLKSFFDLWQDWPDLLPDQRLLAFLFFKYQPHPEDTGLLSRALRAFGRREPVDPNIEIASEIKNLDISAFDRIHGLVLPRLVEIDQPDVEDWAREAAFRLGLSAEGLVRAARDLYRRRQSAPLPMEDLAGELRSILHQHNFPVERSL